MYLLHCGGNEKRRFRSILQLGWMTFKFRTRQGEPVLPLRPYLGLAAKMVRTPTPARMDRDRTKMESCIDSAMRKALTAAAGQEQNTSRRKGEECLHTDLLTAG